MRLTRLTRFLIIPALMIPALAMAQGPGGRGPGGPGGIDRLATELSLTDAQKTQIQAILDAQKTANQPIMTQVQTIQTSMLAAVKANSKAQIDSLAGQLGALQGQMAASRYEGEAAIYALLTADQKAKADAAFPNGLPGFGGGPGGGPGAGFGAQRRGPGGN